MVTHPIQKPKEPAKHRRIDLPYLLIIIAFIGLLCVATYLVTQVDEYSHKAYTLEDQLNVESFEHNETKEQLEITKENLTNTTSQLTAKIDESNSLNFSLKIALNSLNVTKDELDAANASITSLRTELAYARTGGQYLLHDPTLAEVNAFLANDPISNNTYNDTTYTCSYFSRDVKNNAEAKGIRCAMVLLVFNQTLGHAMIGFNATDEGFIYVEPQDDLIKNVVKGGEYWGLEIIDILIIW